MFSYTLEGIESGNLSCEEVSNRRDAIFCSREFTAARPWQHFLCPQHRDAWHNREKTLARGLQHEAYAAEVREAEDRINGTITSA